MSTTSLSTKIKQTYFFLDYLKMHSNGRELQLFKKNRVMLMPEHADDSKKGYKAFIQRIFRTLLDHEFSNYLEIVKPREVFGYNLGPRDQDLISSVPQASPYRAIDIMDNDFGKLLHVYRRNLIYGENRRLISEYISKINNTPTLAFRGKKYFFTVRLDENKSKGWETIKALRQVKSIHKQLIETVNPELEIKKTFKTFVDRILKVQEGQKIFRFEQDSHAIDPSRCYRAVQVSETTDTLGYTTAVSIQAQKLDSNGNDLGRQERIERSTIIPEYSENNAEVAARLGAISSLIEGFKNAWVELALGSQGLDMMTLQPLAVSSYVRNLTPEEESFIRGLDMYGEHQHILADVEQRYIYRRDQNDSSSSTDSDTRRDRNRERAVRAN